MKKITLSEIGLYYGNVEMPKGFEIDREKLKTDILLSQTDRHCVDFITVVSKNCGLIRAKDYFKSEDVEDFYKNFWVCRIFTTSLFFYSILNVFFFFLG